MQFYTVTDLKSLLKLSASQIYALIESGRLKCHRFTTRRNGAVRVSQAQLDAYLKATESGTASPGEEQIQTKEEAPTTPSHSRAPSGFAFLPPKRT
jgi:excisionase family DNA binding protein